MTEYQIYSKRQKILRGEVPDVFQYENIPNALRVQVIHTLRDAFVAGEAKANIYKLAWKKLCLEYGVFSLEGDERADADIRAAILKAHEADRFLDLVEVMFRAIDRVVRQNPLQLSGELNPDDAIAALNARFLEHGVGYQFESGEIVRVDSKLLHQEVVKPALALLHDPQFKGANDEFLTAHEHHRHGRQKECLVECLKAFESTMKTVCALRGWQVDGNATARPLIDACLDNGLFPRYLETQLNSLRTLLTSGVPTARNRQAGHGQGATPVDVPDELAAYALHLTAANIVLLVEAHNRLP